MPRKLLKPAPSLIQSDSSIPPGGRLAAARKKDRAIRDWRRVLVGASTSEEAVDLKRQIHDWQRSILSNPEVTTELREEDRCEHPNECTPASSSPADPEEAR